MIPEVTIFVAQFLMIFLLGLQSINVNRGHRFLAALTSFGLGVAGFYVTGTVAQAYQEGMFSSLFFSFILAGPCGIVVSMILHPYIVRWLWKK